MANPNKPVWPYPDVAIDIDGTKHYAKLWANLNGQWCKKHKKRPHYFGVWSDPDGALAKWRADWPAIVRGTEKPAVRAAAQDVAVTVKGLCNRWLHAKAIAVEAGELSSATFRKYREFAKLAADVLGRNTLIEHLRTSDFQRLRQAVNQFSIYRRSDFIANVRGIFNWGVEARLIDRVPEFGPEFTQPKRRLMRQARKANMNKVMPPGAIRRLLRVADPCEKVIILLGINCGMKSMDIATIDELKVDLRQGVISGHRRKTGSDMLAPLWPETIAAIKAVAHDAPPILRTSDGLPWNGRGTDRVGKVFKDLREQLKLRSDFTQGSLRHTLRTVGGRINRDAVRRIMGQVVGDELDETYDHDDWMPRVKAVSDHVREWVFSPRDSSVSARHADFVARREARGARKSAASSAST